MDQKHAVEDVLLDAGLPGLMLEASMFMEEFWKKYTRPGLLKGTFTFSLPGKGLTDSSRDRAAKVHRGCGSVVCDKQCVFEAHDDHRIHISCVPLPVPSGDRPLQLVAARDVGLVAACALTSSNTADWAGQRLPLAGDELTPLQMCEVFSQTQGGMAVRHSSPPAWLFWFLSR